MKFPAIFILLFSAVYCAHAKDRHTYVIAPIAVVSNSNYIQATLNIRKDGEPYTAGFYSIKMDTPLYKVLLTAMPRLESEELFFEISSDIPFPRSKSLVIPRLSIVTDQVTEDLAHLSSFSQNNYKQQLEFFEKHISNLKEVDENRFLGITPKYVED